MGLGSGGGAKSWRIASIRCRIASSWVPTFCSSSASLRANDRSKSVSPLLPFLLCWRLRGRGGLTSVGNVTHQGIVGPDASTRPGVDVPVGPDVVPSTSVAPEPLFPKTTPVVPARHVLSQADGGEPDLSGRSNNDRALRVGDRRRRCLLPVLQ